MSQVSYVRTADGDLAARVAHLVIALVPMKDGSLRTLTAYPARDPSTCRRDDFSNCGFAANDEDGFRHEVEDFARDEQQKTALGREDLDATALRNITTPWGRPDYGRIYGPGIASVSTPGHGGFILLAAQNDMIDERWRASSGGYAGTIEELLDPEWRTRPAELAGVAFYEEDEQWAVVALTFPHLFTDREIAMANRTLMQSMPDEWEAVTGGTVPEGGSRVRDRAAFRAANPDRWIVGSASRSKTKAGHVVVSATVGGRDDQGRTRGATRLYLMEDAEYDRRLVESGVYECIIDEDVDVLVDRHEEPILIQQAA
jgi:hypothetical protein